jgi:hypothetical protein
MRIGANHINLIPRLHLQLIRLRLNIDGILRSDDLQAESTLSSRNSTAQHPDRLARMHPHLTTGNELRVPSTRNSHSFTIRQLQTLPSIRPKAIPC